MNPRVSAVEGRSHGSGSCHATIPIRSRGMGKFVQPIVKRKERANTADYTLVHLNELSNGSLLFLGH